MDTDSKEIIPQKATSEPENTALLPKRKLNWKGFGIGLIIVIIIEIIAVNALKNDNKQISSAHPNPTQAKLNPIPTVDVTNWQTYSSVSGTTTFTFRYPADYTLENYPNAEPNTFQITSPEKMKAYTDCVKNTPEECTKDEIMLEAKSFSKQPTETLDSFLKQQHFEKNYANVEAFKLLTVAGHPAMQGQSPGYTTVRNTFIDLGKSVVLVTTMADDTFYLNQANQILSTFKFTN